MGTPKYGYLGREYALAQTPNLAEETIGGLRALARARLQSQDRAADQAAG